MSLSKLLRWARTVFDGVPEEYEVHVDDPRGTVVLLQEVRHLLLQLADVLNVLVHIVRVHVVTCVQKTS